MKTTYSRLIAELKETQAKINTQLEGEDLLLTLEKEGNVLVCIEKEFEKFNEQETK